MWNHLFPLLAKSISIIESRKKTWRTPLWWHMQQEYKNWRNRFKIKESTEKIIIKKTFHKTFSLNLKHFPNNGMSTYLLLQLCWSCSRKLWSERKYFLEAWNVAHIEVWKWTFYAGTYTIFLYINAYPISVTCVQYVNGIFITLKKHVIHFWKDKRKRIYLNKSLVKLVTRIIFKRKYGIWMIQWNESLKTCAWKNYFFTTGKKTGKPWLEYSILLTESIFEI